MLISKDENNEKKWYFTSASSHYEIYNSCEQSICELIFHGISLNKVLDFSWEASIQPLEYTTIDKVEEVRN